MLDNMLYIYTVAIYRHRTLNFLTTSFDFKANFENASETW